MTRLAYLPWCQATRSIIGAASFDHYVRHGGCEIDVMWNARLTPIEAAAAICVDEFERTINQ